MATGQGQSGGVFSWPDVPALGPATWAEMSGMHPGHALVGGQIPGLDVAGRGVAIAAQPGTQGAATGSPAAANWRELFNVHGNPMPWVLIAAVLYLGLMHVHVRAGADAGVGRG